MSEAIVAFRQRYPKVSLEFQTETSSRNCFDALTAGNLDLAWVTIAGPARGIEQRPVVALSWVLAVRADDPLAGQPCVNQAELSDISLIRLPQNSTSGARLDAAFAELGVRSSSDTSVADWDTALQLAELGHGHAVVPGWQVPGDGRPPTSRPHPRPAPAPGRLGRPPLGRSHPARPGLRRHGPRSCEERAASTHPK